MFSLYIGRRTDNDWQVMNTLFTYVIYFCRHRLFCRLCSLFSSYPITKHQAHTIVMRVIQYDRLSMMYVIAQYEHVFDLAHDANSALVHASSCGSQSITRFLCDLPPRYNIHLNAQENLPLYLAIMRNHAPIVRLFADYRSRGVRIPDRIGTGGGAATLHVTPDMEQAIRTFGQYSSTASIQREKDKRKNPHMSIRRRK